MRNPFSHSGVVTGDAFCNRQQELEDLIYHAKNSQNVLLYSHRRSGKTSLIHQLMLNLKKQQHKIKSIYIDLYGTIDEKEFIEAVFSGLTQIESKLEKLLKLTSGLKLSGSVDPLTGQPSVSISLDQTDRTQYLEKAMKALSAYSEKQKLLVVFDEFQEIDKYPEKDFEKRLRSHVQQHVNIAYIFSGSQKHILSQMFNTTDRAFYRMATSYPLKQIELKHYIKWASDIFQGRKIELSDDVVTDIVRRCEFQPMYIQQFLFELWRQDEITLDMVDMIEMKIIENRENEFMILWDSLTPNQRKTLRMLAVTGGEGIYYADAMQRFGFKSGSILKRALSSLSSREIITKNKTYHIQDAMLKKWVTRTY